MLASVLTLLVVVVAASDARSDVEGEKKNTRHPTTQAVLPCVGYLGLHSLFVETLPLGACCRTERVRTDAFNTHLTRHCAGTTTRTTPQVVCLTRAPGACLAHRTGARTVRAGKQIIPNQHLSLEAAPCQCKDSSQRSARRLLSSWHYVQQRCEGNDLQGFLR